MLKLANGGQSSNIPLDVLDECLIMAYVDRELDEAGRRHVESLLASSGEARQIAEMMRISCRLVQSAFPKNVDDAGRPS
jgi:anti-sigma factor RsiW